MTITLHVTKREAKAARTPKTIPAVVYGPKQESIPLSIDARTLEKTLKEAGESTIITLDGLEEEIEVLVHDVAFNPEKGGMDHVDFYAIERGKELTTNVALEFIGEAPAEKTGATINKVLLDVEVTCRPSVLPSQIEVDLSVLDTVDAQIRVADLVVADEVTISNDPDDVVANVAAAREEESEVGPATVDMEAVEVEVKGKDNTETEEVEG